MHTLYDCFVNECDPCVLFVYSTGFATVESNFTTYTGCQLKTNENYHDKLCHPQTSWHPPHKVRMEKCSEPLPGWFSLNIPSK